MGAVTATLRRRKLAPVRGFLKRAVVLVLSSPTLEQRTRAAARQAAKAQPQAQTVKAADAPAQPAAAKVTASKAEAAKAHDGKPAGGQRQKQDGGGQRKPIEREIAKLEQEIERLTAEKGRLETLLGDPDLYLPPRQAELAAALARSGDIATRLEAAEADWMARQEMLAGLAQL